MNAANRQGDRGGLINLLYTPIRVYVYCCTKILGSRKNTGIKNGGLLIKLWTPNQMS